MDEVENTWMIFMMSAFDEVEGSFSLMTLSPDTRVLYNRLPGP